MDTEAITPTRAGLLQFARDIKRAEAEEANKHLKLDNDDISLQELTTLPGWKVLLRLFENRKKMLKPQFDIKGTDDDFFKSYGMRSVVYDIVSDQLDSIVRRVEDAREVVETRRVS